MTRLLFDANGVRSLSTFIVCCALCCRFIMAQDKQVPLQTENPQAERSPFSAVPHVKVPKEMALLRGLIGTWDAEEHWERVEGFAPGGNGTGLEIVKEGPGGLSIVIDYKALTGPFPMYSGHGMMSWELDPAEYRMVWVQPIWPGISVETGNVETNTGNLVMSYEIVENGKKYTVKNVYANVSANSYTESSYLIDVTGRAVKTLTLNKTRRTSN
jgi:hypothetical protein